MAMKAVLLFTLIDLQARENKLEFSIKNISRIEEFTFHCQFRWVWSAQEILNADA